MSSGFRSRADVGSQKYNAEKWDDGVLSFSLKRRQQLEERYGSLFDFDVPPMVEDWLNSKGVYVSPGKSYVHSHPINKLLENHMLFVVALGLIQDFKSWNLVSMKGSKARILQCLKPDADLTLINRIITGGDVFRYGGEGHGKIDDMIFNDIDYHVFTDLANQFDFEKLKRFAGEKRNFLFHDEMHHWTKDNFLDFFETVEPEVVISTIVYPLELLAGIKDSAHPLLYTLEMHGDGSFSYLPDGVGSEAYHHKQLDLGWLFSASHFVVNGVTYSVKLNRSIGAHHVFTFERNSRPDKKFRIFNEFDVLDLSNLSEFRYKFALPNVSYHVFMDVITFLLSLKNPDPETAAAKHRQSKARNLSRDLREVLLLMDLAKRMKSCGVESISDHSFWQKLLSDVYAKLPYCIQRLSMKKFSRVHLTRSLYEAKPLIMKMQTVQLRRTGRVNILKLLGLDCTIDDVRKNCLPKYETVSTGVFGLFQKNEKMKDVALMDEVEMTDILTASALSVLNKGKNLEEFTLLTPEKKDFNENSRPEMTEIMPHLSYDPLSLNLRGAENVTPNHNFERKDLLSMIDRLKANNANILSEVEDLSYKVKKESCPQKSIVDNSSDSGGFDLFNELIDVDSISCLKLSDIVDDIPKLKLITSVDAERDARIADIEEQEIKKNIASPLQKVCSSSLDLRDPNLDLTEVTQEEVHEEFLESSQVQIGDCACVVKAMASALNMEDFHDLLSLLMRNDETVYKEVYASTNTGISLDLMHRMAVAIGCKFKVFMEENVTFVGVDKKKVATRAIKVSFGSVDEIGHAEALEEIGYDPTEIKRKSISDQILEISPMHRKVEVDVDFDDAKNLARHFKMNKTGVILNNLGNKSHHMDEIINSGCSGTEKTTFHISYGFAGCGKTRPVIDWLNSKNQLRCLVISPRKNLKDDMKSKINLQSADICTFEIALSRDLRNYQLIIVDEIGLYPEGYLEVLVTKKHISNSSAEFLILGDPLQKDYFSRKDEGCLRGIKFPSDFVVPYAAWTHRCGSWLKRFVNVTTMCNSVSCVTFIPNTVDCTKYPNIPILVPSREVKGMIINERRMAKCKEVPVMTYGESQGLTFERCTIVFSRASLSNDDNSILVALTRSREAPTIALWDTEASLTHKAKGLLKSILKQEVFELESKYVKYGLTAIKNPLFGKREGVAEEKFKDDVLFLDKMNLGQISDESEIVIEEPLIPDVKLNRPSYANAFNVLKCHIIDNLGGDRENAERVGNQELLSEQFVDREKGRYPSQVSGNVMNHVETVYPRHHHTDKVTFKMSVKKRFIAGDPRRNMQEFRDAKHFGKDLLCEFLDFVNLDRTYDETLFEECKEEFQKKRELKSKTLIKEHSNRSDPDWNENEIFLFLKSQLCTKFDNEFIQAKAGQLVSCFSHSSLLRFAHYIRYIEKKVNLGLSESNVYIHSMKNFDTLNEWVKENATGCVSVESDFSKFDASQDAKILAFEVELMNYLNIPREVISDYIFLKCNLGSKLGEHAIMRFSGEAGTFAFNTIVNMAYTFCRYKVDKRTPMCFAGDDMVILKDVRLRNDKDYLLKKMALKAKVVKTDNPTFCGWGLTPFGIFKRPELILKRLLIALEMGKLEQCEANYFEEFRFNLALGGVIHDYLDEQGIVSECELELRFRNYYK